MKRNRCRKHRFCDAKVHLIIIIATSSTSPCITDTSLLLQVEFQPYATKQGSLHNLLLSTPNVPPRTIYNLSVEEIAINCDESDARGTEVTAQYHFISVSDKLTKDSENGAQIIMWRYNSYPWRITLYVCDNINLQTYISAKIFTWNYSPDIYVKWFIDTVRY